MDTFNFQLSTCHTQEGPPSLVASGQDPQCEIWKRFDFPVDPPAAADISLADYQTFKRDLMGKSPTSLGDTPAIGDSRV